MKNTGFRIVDGRFTSARGRPGDGRSLFLSRVFPQKSSTDLLTKTPTAGGEYSDVDCQGFAIIPASSPCAYPCTPTFSRAPAHQSQRKETKRERAARGLETTTRQTGGAPPLPSLSGTTTNNGNGNSASTAGASTAASAMNSIPNKTASISSREEGDGSEGRASPPPPADAGGESDKRPEARDRVGEGKATTSSLPSSPPQKDTEGEVVGSEKAAATAPRKDEGSPEGRKRKGDKEKGEKGGDETRDKVSKAEAAASADSQKGDGGGSSPMEIEGEGAGGERKATVCEKEPRSAAALVRNSDVGERTEGEAVRKTGEANEKSSATATAAAAAVSGKKAASPMDVDGEERRRKE